MTIPTKPECPYNPERVCRGQCFQCHDENRTAPVFDPDAEAERGDELRAAERDEELYLSMLRETEGSR